MAKTYVYYHRIIVDVCSTECSPDAIEKLIDGLSTSRMRFDARTTAVSRSQGPAIEVRDEPEYPKDSADSAEYYMALDSWFDSWPSMDHLRMLWPDV